MGDRTKLDKAGRWTKELVIKLAAGCIKGISCQQLRQNQYTWWWRTWDNIGLEQQGQLFMKTSLVITTIKYSKVLSNDF